MSADCPLCEGKHWVCKVHHDEPWPHEGCEGQRIPCPFCNDHEPPLPQRLSALAIDREVEE